jgi:hypothetical protein
MYLFSWFVVRTWELLSEHVEGSALCQQAILRHTCPRIAQTPSLCVSAGISDNELSMSNIRSFHPRVRRFIVWSMKAQAPMTTRLRPHPDSLCPHTKSAQLPGLVSARHENHKGID